MQRHVIDTSLNRSPDLAGCAVGIFVVNEQKCQIGMPQISLQTMLFRKLKDLIDTFKEQIFRSSGL